MKIWICIPVFNRISMTLKCIESLQAQTYKNFITIICDHGSTDGTTEAIRRLFPDVIIISADSTLWWTGAINRSIAYAIANASADDAVLTMNNDNEVPPDYLQNLVDIYLDYPNSIITSVVHDIKTGQPISMGYRQNWFLATAYPITFNKDHLPASPNIAEVTHASGRGTLFPLQTFKDLGLFDEEHLPHYAADYDFTFKAVRAGYRIYSCLNCQVFSYVEETGLVKVLNQFTLKSFINYFTNMRSPGNIQARWWLGWNNCPRWYFPIYLMIDSIRVTGSYFKKFVLNTAS